MNACAVADDYPLRTWTNDEGQTLDATLKRISGGTAILDDNGTEIRAPISRLSEEDKEWIKKVRELIRWREWTMADNTTQRAKLESFSEDVLVMKTRESEVDVEWSLDELADSDRALLAEVFSTSSNEDENREWDPTLGGGREMLEDGMSPSGMNPAGMNPAEGAPAGVNPSGMRPGEIPIRNIGTVRDWTDNNYKTISAEFRGLDGPNVVLFFKNREWRVPLTDFSFEDQQWVMESLMPDPNAVDPRMVAENNPGGGRMSPPQFGNQPMTAGGSQFDSAHDSITGRMNPGLGSGDEEGMMANNSPAEQDEVASRIAEARAKQMAGLEQKKQDDLERAARLEESANAEDSYDTDPTLASSPSMADNSYRSSNASRSNQAALSSSTYGANASARGSGGPNAFGVLLMYAGLLISAVGGIWTLVVAAQESIVWLLACMFVPFAGLVFIITHWEEASKPFLINLGGTLLMFFGIFVAAM
ncbi:hypothetical protein [Aeoliella mucimassa]|uniref:hypothetical protein n=1 Tax=Aeoliella mucimassa TaxID=2527972 RepID=UPI0018D35BB5|nr:hypothetical protein [Aeoliella mucimassa]